MQIIEYEDKYLEDVKEFYFKQGYHPRMLTTIKKIK